MTLRRSLALLVAGAALAACDALAPVSPPAEPAAAEPTLLAALRCTATIAPAAVSCGDAGPGLGAASGVIVGGQGTYVLLAASNTVFNEGSGVFSMDVTVRNLIPQALGTTDGSTLDAEGVRVFFNSGPNGNGGAATLLNADGAGFFLAAGQPYFQWDEVLAQDGTSGARSWQFGLQPGATGFTFTVYVAARVQFPDGWIDLALDRDTLVAGGSAALTATVRSVVGNELPGEPVTFGTLDGAVASADGVGAVTAVAPGTTMLTATSGSRSGSVAIAVCPNLAVGGVYTASMPAAADLCLAGGESGNAEYTYIPVNLSDASVLSLTVTGNGITGVTGPPTPLLAPTGTPLLGRSGTAGPVTDEGYHTRMMERDRQELERLMGRPSARVSRGARADGPSRLIVPGVPAVGDLWPLNVASGCAGTRDDRIGRVVSLGQHVIIVADTTNPAGGFTTAQYDSIALEYDSIAHPAVVNNFGAPTDLDNNGRVVAFYTRAVNELSPPASSAVVAGYFAPRDLFSSAPESCPRSNEGEMFYMLVPDPTGAVNGTVRTVSSVRAGTVGTMGHEFQHLVNAARRIYVNNAPGFEEVWLNEGLSHIVEELMFYRTSGLAPRGNILLSTLTSGPNASRRVAAFNAYANQNFGRMRSWLQRPDTAGAFKNNDVLATRGAIWGFLRYAADRRNGNDAAFWFDLANTTAVGKANLQNVLGVNPDVWVRDFNSAMYADDAVAGIGAAQQVTSWNFRSVYGGLGGVPHGTRLLSNGAAMTLSYSPGGGSTFTRFGVPTGTFAGVTALSAGMPPTSPYALIVLRTK